MREHPIIFSGPMVRAILEGCKTETRRVFKVRGVDGGAYAITSPKEEILRMDDGTFHYLSTAALSGPYECPYGQPGDRLWVRETWGVVSCAFNESGDMVKWAPDRPATAVRDMRFGARGYYTGHVIYAADGSFEWTDEDDGELRSAWKPSIHMPRMASRITLEITDVRVQRVQDISEEDAIAEGCAARPFPGPWWQGYRDIDGDLIHQEAVGEFPPDWMIEPHRMRDLSHLDVSARDAFRNLWDSINEKRGFGWNANPWVWVLTFKRVTEAAG